MARSLFARRLRDYRSSAGEHGRLTQERLAEMLGVSLDAVSKYERSLSYIRGDLEHRLSERLGWSREDVLACREDWEAQGTRAGAEGYWIVDNASPGGPFNGSLEAAVIASIELAETCMGDLPVGLEANMEIFTGNYLAFPDHWAMAMQGDRPVGKWALLFLLPEDAEQFRSGALLETTLTADRLRVPLLPGRYYGYSPALIVAPGHEAAVHLLLQSFIRFLENLARRDIFVEAMGTVAVSQAGAQVCRDLGMIRICDHALERTYGCWELPGINVASSIFGRRSRFVRSAYEAEFGADGSRASSRE